jgi:hypothetical protein
MSKRERRKMQKKLTPSEIDERNSRLRLPMNDGKLDYERFAEMAHTTFITRKDGSEVSLAHAVYADIDWLHRSQERHVRRLVFGVPEHHGKHRQTNG